MSTSPLQPDPYEALGISRDADTDAIKKAHRKLVLKHHPDRIKDPALVEQGKNEFQKVQQAYELLIDPVRRQRYDDEVRLAQLRKERMMNEREAARSSYTRTTYAARPTTAPTQPVPREMKPETRYAYEERTPDTYFEGPQGKVYEEPIPRGTVRKDPLEKRSPAAKAPEKKEKSRVSGWDRPAAGLSMRMAFGLKDKAKAARQRTEEKEAHARNAKARDKEERRERQEKENRTRAQYSRPFVDDGSDDGSSESDFVVYERRRAPQEKGSKSATRERSPLPTSRGRSPQPTARERSPVPKYKRHLTPEPPKRRQETARQYPGSDIEEYASPDEWEYRHTDATHYIHQSREGRAPPGRPPLSRQGSDQYWTKADLEKNHRRSGSDSDRQRQSGTTKHPGRSMPREDAEFGRRPSLQPHSSAPSGVRAAAASLRNMEREIPTPRSRQGSYDSRTPGHRQNLFAEIPELKRTSSDPVSPKTAQRKDTAPSKPSTLKQAETTHDSGYGSSPNHTPEMRGDSPPHEPRATTTKYRARKEEDDQHHRARKLSPDGRTRKLSPDGRTRKLSPDGRTRKLSPDPRARRASFDARAQKLSPEVGESDRYLSAESAQIPRADDKRERRTSRSREPEPRSRPNRTGPTERRPSFGRADSSPRFEDPRPRSKAMAAERPDDRGASFSRRVDPGKVKYSTRAPPTYANYEDHHPALYRSMREGRKASAY